MTSEHIAKLERVYDAWARGDFRAGADLLTADAEFAIDYPHGPQTYVGSEGAARYMREILREWHDMRVEAERIVDLGDRVFVAQRQTQTGRMSGVRVEQRTWAVWSFSGEKVDRLQFCADEDDARQAAGLAEPANEGDALPARPRKKLAVLACMDARLDVYRVLGLEPGDAHVIRNAGGIVTDDAIRSLAISQRLLGTEEIVLIHHTRCGMLGLDDGEFRRALAEETGAEPEWDAGGFADLEGDVRDSIARIQASPFLPSTGNVRGFVYEVETGRLREVG